MKESKAAERVEEGEGTRTGTCGSGVMLFIKSQYSSVLSV